MNKLMMLIAAFPLTFNLLSGSENITREQNELYCLKLQDGLLVVVHDGKPLTAEVTLDNGTKVHPNGTITLNDGTKSSLKEGECIDEGGKLTREVPGNKD